MTFAIHTPAKTRTQKLEARLALTISANRMTRVCPAPVPVRTFVPVLPARCKIAVLLPLWGAWAATEPYGSKLRRPFLFASPDRNCKYTRKNASCFALLNVHSGLSGLPVTTLRRAYV